MLAAILLNSRVNKLWYLFVKWNALDTEQTQFRCWFSPVHWLAHWHLSTGYIFISSPEKKRNYCGGGSGGGRTIKKWTIAIAMEVDFSGGAECGSVFGANQLARRHCLRSEWALNSLWSPSGWLSQWFCNHFGLLINWKSVGAYVFTHFGQVGLALYDRLPVAIFIQSLENHKASIMAH